MEGFGPTHGRVNTFAVHWRAWGVPMKSARVRTPARLIAGFRAALGAPPNEQVRPSRRDEGTLAYGDPGNVGRKPTWVRAEQQKR